MKFSMNSLELLISILSHIFILVFHCSQQFQQEILDLTDNELYGEWDDDGWGTKL